MTAGSARGTTDGLLVLLRHGESAGNRESRFTGWDDEDLTEGGREEARRAARLLEGAGLSFDAAFASCLRRAIRTLWIVLDEMDLMWVPVRVSWRLNERHYGAVQGMSKAEAAERYGEERVRQWRRDYRARPPELEAADERHPGHDPRYADLGQDELPLTESLEDVSGRLLPYWHEEIAPAVKGGVRTLVVAHGNSLRALVKHLDGLSDEEVADLEIPAGSPLVYEFDGEEASPARRYYLGDGD